MRKFSIAGTFLCLFISASLTVDAQETGFFSGNGFKDGWGGSQRPIGSDESSSLFKFQQPAPQSQSARKGFELPTFKMPKFKAPDWEMPKLFPRENFPRPIQLSDSPNQGLLSGFSSIDPFSNREPGEPTFFQRMNMRTRNALDRTRAGFSNLTNRSRATWDSISRSGFGGSQNSGNFDATPVQPDLKSARQVEDFSSKF